MSSPVISVKILLVGLDNSGKTSIALSLQKNSNLLSYCNLKPTHGLDIVRVLEGETNYALWDLGGQEQYRDEYLEDLGKYTTEVDKIIFVIDIQDKDRYEMAFNYLKDVVNYLKDNNHKVDFSVFLHKFDPNLEEKDEFSYEKVSSELVSKIKGMIPSDFRHNIFQTCIYTVFQKSLIE